MNELIPLLMKYNADMYYTNEDDGIHISVDGEDIYAGPLNLSEKKQPANP